MMGVGYYAFDGCSELSAITLPATVTYLGNYAFAGTAIRTFAFPEAFVDTSLREGLFDGCADLESIVVPDQVKTINKYVFRDCSALEDVTLPANLTSLGGTSMTSEGAVFMGCASLETVELPVGVTVLPKNTFSGCTSLETITTHGTVSLGVDALAGCTSLKAATEHPADGTVMNVDAANGMVYFDTYAGNVLTDRTVAAYIGSAAQITETMFLDGVTTIGAYAFYQNLDITSVVIPATVSTIELAAFYGCENLTNVSFPAPAQGERALTIEDGSSSTGAFGKTGIVDLILPEGLTYIGKYAFYGGGTSTASIETVSFPSTLKTIGEYAFDSQNIVDLVIPEGVTTIGEYAFRNSQLIKSITLPSTLEYLGNSAFYQDYALEKIVINGNSIVMMDGDEPETSYNSAFYKAGRDSDGITVYFGENVTAVPARLFYSSSSASNQPKVTDVVFLGDKVTSVGTDAFRGVTTVERVYFGGTAEQLLAVAAGLGTNDKTALAGAAFYLYSETMPAANADNTDFAGVGTTGGIQIAGYWKRAENGEPELWVFSAAGADETDPA